MKLPMLPFVLSASLALAGAAQAQTPASGRQIFAAARFGPNWDDRYSASNRIPGAVLEGGVSFGIESASAGIEVDLSVPSAWHVQENGPHRFRYAGETSGYLQKDRFYESTSTNRRRSTELGVLYRRNFHPGGAGGVLTLTGVVGGAFVFRPSESVGVTREVLPDGRLVEVDRYEQRSSRNYLAGVGGLDAAIRVSSHVAIVARLRVTAFPALLDDSGSAPRLLVAHPQIAVRWTF